MRLDPFHRASLATFTRTTKPQQTESAQSTSHFDLGAADYLAAAQTKPFLGQASPGAESIEALEQL